MHPTAKKFRDKVGDEFDLKIELKEFQKGTKTAKDAADAVGCEVDQIAKSIVMQAGDELVVVVTSGVNRVDEEKLAGRLGVSPGEVEPANPDRVKDELGWGIGGVPPFAHQSDPPVFLDTHLTDFGTIWAAAGTPSAVFPIEPEELRKLAEAEVIDFENS